MSFPTQVITKTAHHHKLVQYIKKTNYYYLKGFILASENNVKCTAPLHITTQYLF